jgi:hypothetical protein
MTWLTDHPNARLVVVDVLKRIRGRTPPGVSYYDADYVTVARIKKIADQFGVAIVAIHHTRKADADDYLDEVSGTAGLTGAADAIAVLKRARGQAAAVLHLTGRDVDEANHALTSPRTLDSGTCSTDPPNCTPWPTPAPPSSPWSRCTPRHRPEGPRRRLRAGVRADPYDAGPHGRCRPTRHRRTGPLLPCHTSHMSTLCHTCHTCHNRRSERRRRRISK